MSALRRISTRRLLTISAIAVLALIGVVAAAAAMTGGGPKPQPKPLANAVQDALSAPAVPGISARIEFTNHLVSSSSIEGASPLLAGASGRLWASPDQGGKLRLELQSEGGGGDTQVLVSEQRFQLYDSGSETVYEGALPEEHGKDSAGAAEGIPALAEIESEIVKVEKHADLSGAVPSSVAGQPTYTLRIAPKHDGGLLGGAEVAWDANNGTPLRAAIYSSASTSPVLQLEATDVSFEAIPSSVFEISPPAGAKVVDLNPGGEAGDHSEPATKTGADAVQKSLDFELVAPDSLAGLPRGEVRGVEIDGKTAALVTYGKGLGGIAVLESASEAGAEPEPSSEAGLSLPKVSINGAQGEELDTALGTVLRFSRGGVDYIVAGSVPPAAAEAAARAL